MSRIYSQEIEGKLASIADMRRLLTALEFGYMEKDVGTESETLICATIFECLAAICIRIEP